MPAVELFRTADVAVRHLQGFSRACCFVTFDSFTDFRNLDRHGFAELFLEENRIDAVHILSRENDWYQYPDFLDVCARARELTAGYDRVVAYGSSMGGYAAIRFGRLVGATVAFALSPQFSIDPARVPFEHRWNHDAARVRPLYEADPPPFVETAIVVYDKHDLDGRHVGLYRGATNIVDVPLLNCGHPCGGYLAELKLLQESTRAIAAGTFDPAWLRSEARARRKEAGQFYLALSLRARQPASKVRLMELAVEKSPLNAGYLAHLAALAAANGEPAKAMDALERGSALAPTHPVIRFNRSLVLEFKGDLEGALEVMSELAEESSLYQHRLDDLRTRAARADGESWTAPPPPPPPPAPQSREFRPGPVIPPKPRLAHARRVLAGKLFRLVNGAGVPPNSRRIVLPGIERAGVETRVTTFPSPPPFAESWRRHDRLVRTVPRFPIELMLVGDSLAEYWPAQLWSHWSMFNFGVAADKTQHVIWRLDEVTRRIAAKRVLLVIGTNNLGAADTPEGIVAGIAELLRRLALAAPGAEALVLEIPPCGPEFDFRDADRKRANQLLRKSGMARTLDAEAALLTPDHASNPYYQPDHIHFSVAGYQVLTQLARDAWA